MKKWQKATLVSALAIAATSCFREWEDLNKYVVVAKADNNIVYRGVGTDTVHRVMQFQPGKPGMDLYQYLMPGDTIVGPFIDNGEYVMNSWRSKGAGDAVGIVLRVNGKAASQFIMERRGIMKADSIIVKMRSETDRVK